ncbi:MAG: hypothetical protein GX256_07105 [Fretibacterium sp.]|nr:hypothetical protein [Fretibacterium sp.]
MRPRRRRVDWDEELRKTERIRKKGFFISGLSFAVAMVVLIGASRMGGDTLVAWRKVIAIFSLIIAAFLFRAVARRRERLRREREGEE